MTGIINEDSMLYIADIIDKWGISRPLIQRAIKEHTISGIRNDEGKWCFDSSEIERWRGKSNKATQNAENKDEVIVLLKEQNVMLREQLQKKDEQIEKLQLSMQDQMKLLTYSGAGSTAEMAKLQEKIDKKDKELDKLSLLKVEAVVKALRADRPTPAPSAVEQIDHLYEQVAESIDGNSQQAPAEGWKFK